MAASALRPGADFFTWKLVFELKASGGSRPKAKWVVLQLFLN